MINTLLHSWDTLPEPYKKAFLDNLPFAYSVVVIEDGPDPHSYLFAGERLEPESVEVQVKVRVPYRSLQPE